MYRMKRPLRCGRVAEVRQRPTDKNLTTCPPRLGSARTRPLEVHPAGSKMSIAETICSLRFVRFTSRVRVCVTVVLQVEESSSNGE